MWPLRGAPLPTQCRVSWWELVTCCPSWSLHSVWTAKRAPWGFPGFSLFWTAESSGGLGKGSCIQLFQKPISSWITIGHFLFGTWFRQRGFYMYHVPPDSLKRKPGIWNLGLFFCLLTERLAGYLVNTVLFLMSLLHEGLPEPSGHSLTVSMSECDPVYVFQKINFCFSESCVVCDSHHPSLM